MLTVPQRRSEAEQLSGFPEVQRPHLLEPSPATPAGHAAPPARIRAAGPDARRIAIKEKGRIVFLRVAEVAIVKAEGNYVELVCDSGSHLLRESISVAEEVLGRLGFVRIHRSALVNASRVDEIRPLSNGEFMVRMKGGQEHKATRTYRQNLRSLADCWLGTDPFLETIAN
ncbi:MAG TPA: LytTR family DNA-binding domain-containing protein [Terriglobales bacterium]|nr:LytTR family DNA-binding domain-containing protein [Terriglobales bacterium]